MILKSFRSVVARRIFALFVVCALVPIALLALISYLQVSRQLERQSAARLQQGSKMVGMATVERLQVLEQRLRLFSAELPESVGGPGVSGTPDAWLEGFESVTLVAGSSGDRVLHGEMTEALAPVTPAESSQVETGRPALRVLLADEPRVLLGLPTAVDGRDGMLWAELDREFLWGAALDAKPPETEICVVEASGTALHCSGLMSPSEVESLHARLVQRRGDAFDWSDDDAQHLVAGWSIFMRFGYGIPDWTVVLMQSRSSVLAPVAGFRSIFVSAMLLVLLGVILLSSIQIRRSLHPLEELRVGIRRLANRDFDTPVDLRSGDEFEAVAASFNEMAVHLRDQFAEGERLNAALRETGGELAERSARLTTILDTAADGILVVNEDGTLETMNVTALDMFECTEQHAVGAPIETFLPGTSLREGSFEGPPVAATGRRRSGEEFPIEWTAKRTALDGRGVAVVMVRDVSERVAAERERELLERQLRQAQKMETIGTLAGGIAHDFNNILSPIIGYVDLTLMDVDPTSETHENLEQVRIAAMRAKDLVRQVLSFSRQTEQQATVVTLRVIVHEALRLLKASLPATIQIEERFEDMQATVVADPTQLHQVVMNLCTNAYHAMRETGGVLRVAVSSVQLRDTQPVPGAALDSGDYVCLTVTDSGTGMSEATVERIFEPFFTTKGPQEGTGLGLSVVHGIVKDHGGAIAVESALGKGTTFTVYLPRVTAEAEAKQEVAVLPTGCHGRVLVVDDDAQIVRVQTRMLERSGYQVTGAVGSATALQHFESTPAAFDLIVTDHTMPQMTGIVLAKEIWSIRPDIPIILTSGFGEGLTDERIKAAGFATFLRKPLQPVELTHAVSRVLATASGGAASGEGARA